jgi:hypothetical protein
MGCFLVDPTARMVTAIEIEGDFLDSVRREIGASTLDVIAVAEHRFAVWADALGMLKPGRDFWRFSDAEFRFSGKSLITGLNEDGLPVPFPEGATAADVHAGIAWHGSDELLAIEEVVLVVPGADGRPTPVINRLIRWKPEEPLVTPSVGGGWTVYERNNGTYRAVLYELRGEGDLEAMQMLSAPNLEELHRQLPAGLIHKEADDEDAPEVIEHWLVPDDH